MRPSPVRRCLIHLRDPMPPRQRSRHEHAEKDLVFGEVRRVLEPGGRFAGYEQMRVGDGDNVAATTAGMLAPILIVARAV